MTRSYGEGDLAEYFPSIIFLVFCNRFLAVFLAAALMVSPLLCVVVKNLKFHVLLCDLKAPLSQYALASVSNIVSSWAQYEALKYVSFPTQLIKTQREYKRQNRGSGPLISFMM